VIDLNEGRIEMQFGAIAASLPHVRDGKLRALAVTSQTRVDALPDVPAFAEAGFPGYEAVLWMGIIMPPGTPAALVERMNREVRAAVADQPGFSVDDREVRRSGVSYSVDTLTELRAEFPDRSLCLLLGMDAFLGLPNWHRWQEILDLAHVVVAHRPGWKAPVQGPLGEAMVDRGTGAVRDLHERPAGHIFVHAVTQLEISSTDLRQLLAAGRNPRYLVPDSVCNVLRETGCYARRQH
jgi:nicotinate-nucleotide adenylyltransferase